MNVYHVCVCACPMYPYVYHVCWLIQVVLVHKSFHWGDCYLALLLSRFRNPLTNQLHICLPYVSYTVFRSAVSLRHEVRIHLPPLYLIF